MWMRLTLTVNRAAILKRRKRIWPIEATASSVPFKTVACRVLNDQMRKGREPEPQLVGSHPVGASAIGKQIHLLLFRDRHEISVSSYGAIRTNCIVPFSVERVGTNIYFCDLLF